VYKVLLSINLCFIPVALRAQPPTPALPQRAQDYFHRGAQYYIWNQKQKATNEIFSGLQLFPTDPQLNGLAQLLKKEEQEQKQQQQQQQQDQQDQQSKQDQNQQQQQQAEQKQDQKQDASQQNQPNQQNNQDQQQQQAAKQEQDQQKQQGSQEASQSKEESGETNQQQYAAGEMTPEQARQLLDAQKGDEKMLSPKPEGKPNDRRKPLRDW
jgi:hypothetical protein